MTKRYERMTANRVTGLFMVFMIAISLAGVAYAHWGDTVKIEGTVKMAHIKLTLTSWKVLTTKDVEKYSTISEGEISDDQHTLTITADNLKPCWLVWVGIVAQNQGSLPAEVKPPEITCDDPDALNDYFEYITYTYGPYPESTGYGKLEVWGKVKVGEYLMPDGTVTFDTPTNEPPFVTDPGEKIIIWIWLHVREDAPPSSQGKLFTIYITIVDDMAL